MAVIAGLVVGILITAMVYIFFKSGPKKREGKYVWVGNGPDPFK